MKSRAKLSSWASMELATTYNAFKEAYTMKRLLLSFLFLLSLSSLFCSALSPEDLQGDALFLLEMLEEAHPHLYHTTPKEKVEEYMTTWKQRMQQKEDLALLAAYRELATIAALFRDGHTNLIFPQQEWSKFLSHGGGILPLRVKFQDDALFIQDLFDEERFAEGTELLSINGVETKDLLQTMLGAISYESRFYGAYMVNQYFHQYLWAFLGIEEPFTITYLSSSQSEETLLLDGLKMNEWPAREQRDLYEFMLLTPSIGVLRIDSVPRDRNEEYFVFLQESFKEIEERGLTDLIIDMRNNGGGSTDQFNEIYYYISEAPYRPFSSIEVNYSKPYLAQQPWPTRIFYRIRNLIKGDSLVTREPELREPPKRDFSFQGQAYLLVGPGTFSAAADFAALCQDFGAAIIVGEETGGWPTSYGDSFYFTLPRTGLLARSSYKFFVRPSGERELQGVIPDWEMVVDGEYTNLLHKIEELGRE